MHVGKEEGDPPLPTELKESLFPARIKGLACLYDDERLGRTS